ncbi:LysE family translocator [Pseudomonas sp. PvP001]|uniref:LysE family translocator n=1 Tax=Pseudomonas coleopterorum TaxID=1605838 RepID=A0ABR9BWR9_9PSED|nr:LysE family translocator [Pseudomonas coleopterorum]MBD8768868.1 LysE family translocator [Pseudomonas coleopterorum]
MSFDIHLLLLVFVTYIMGAASPGPSNMRIMSVAMHQGRRPALMLAAGVISGSFFWGSMAATGVSAVIVQYAEALIVLKVIGGAYLLFLASKACRSALTSNERFANELSSAPKASGWKLYQRGLLMHLTNPKAILSWIATMTLGLGPGATTSTVAIILAGCAVLSVTIFGGYAVVFSTAPMVRAYQKARRWIEGALAMVFAGAGLRLLFGRA